jgi:hypothetical protein
MTVTVLDRALVAGDAGRVTGEQERPDWEVPERGRRRTFTAQYKLDVVAEYNAAATGLHAGAGAGSGAASPSNSADDQTIFPPTMVSADSMREMFGVVDIEVIRLEHGEVGVLPDRDGALDVGFSGEFDRREALLGELRAGPAGRDARPLARWRAAPARATSAGPSPGPGPGSAPAPRPSAAQAGSSRLRG